MAEEYVSKQDVIDILQREGIDEKDLEIIYPIENESVIESTKKLIKLYRTLLAKDDTASEKAAYSLGGVIVFSLRKFVVGKDIIMYMGGTDADNDNLAIIKKPLTEILKDSSTYKITDKALALHSAIEKYDELNKIRDTQHSAVWKRILDASELKGKHEFDASKEDASIILSDKNKRSLYRRKIKDIDVYYGYSGSNIYSYYETSSGWYQFFNNGWLFEHFEEKWMKASGEQKENYIEISKGDHPVVLGISKTDNTPGYKGGDVQYRGKDYQMKYGNQQIITKKSIDEVLTQIESFLDMYKKERSGAKKKLSQSLVDLFTEKGNVQLTKVNNTYEKVVDKMVNSLTRRIDK